jgi:Flp pilus assembly protein TadD
VRRAGAEASATTPFLTMSKSPTPTKHKKHARGASTPAPDVPEASGAGLVFGEGRILFLLAAVSALVYANSLGGQFVVDDPKQIVNNPALRSWGNVLRAFTTDVWSFQRAGAIAGDVPPPYYRPLFTAYTTIGYQLFGLWPQGWHLLSVAVHAAATILVYHLIKRVGGSVVAAVGGALLFAVHPAHVESVAWASGVPDPLAALFYIPALIWFVRYRREGGNKFLALSVGAYALALLCKETALVLPLVIAAWDLTRERDSTLFQRVRRAALACVPYFAVAAAYLMARVAVLGAVGWTHPVMAGVSRSTLLLTAPLVLASYAQHLVAPFYLSFQYGLPLVREASDAHFLLPLLLLAALGFVLWYFRRSLTAEHVLALALVVAPLLPVLNLKALHPDYLVQDRYLYLPSIGLCWLAGLAFARLARGNARAAWALAAAVLVAFALSTVMQNRVWAGPAELWGRAAAYAPNSWSVHYNLGLAHTNERRYAEAKAELETAARLNPEVANVYNSLGLAEDALGDSKAAAEHLRRALRIDPNMTEAHNNLGAVLFRRGEYAAARAELEEALRREPANASARYNLARTLAASGDHASAVTLYESVLAASPDDSEARFQLALSYAANGRKELAESEIERALRDERVPERAAEMRARLAELRGAAR